MSNRKQRKTLEQDRATGLVFGGGGGGFFFSPPWCKFHSGAIWEKTRHDKVENLGRSLNKLLQESGKKRWQLCKG